MENTNREGGRERDPRPYFLKDKTDVTVLREEEQSITSNLQGLKFATEINVYLNLVALASCSTFGG